MNIIAGRPTSFYVIAGRRFVQALYMAMDHFDNVLNYPSTSTRGPRIDHPWGEFGENPKLEVWIMKPDTPLEILEHVFEMANAFHASPTMHPPRGPAAEIPDDSDEDHP